MAEPVLTQIANRIFRIILNRPLKKNALTGDMYGGIDSALRSAATNKDTVVTVICARGDYYTSGNDLSNFGKGDPAEVARQAHARLLFVKIVEDGLNSSFVGAFIEHPKPLIALVQGPAVGIGMTTLGLCDVVYASQNATFNTPFGTLGQTPEGCSSYTFPQLMGRGVATEVLMFGRKLTASEALEYRLVTEVFPHAEFESAVEKRLADFASRPPNTLALMKRLIVGRSIEELHSVNRAECDQLQWCWQSDECKNAIRRFFQEQIRRKAEKAKL